MSNALYKSILSTYVPGSPGVPADPGQQYQPAGYYWENQQVCEWKAVTTYTGASTGLISVTEYVYECSTKRVKVFREEQPYRPPSPAVDPVPAQFINDYQLGWNSGARSISTLYGDGYASFTVPHSNTGTFIGLNDADLSAGYMELNYAIYAHRGIAEVYENGVFKHYIGPYVEGAVFKIRRRRRVVTYIADDVVVYTSATQTSAPLFLDVSIYTGGEYVDNPQIVEEFGADGAMSFEPMQVFGSDHPHAEGAMSFEPMTVSGHYGVHVAMSFEPMQVFGSDHPHAEGAMSFEPMTVSGESGMLKPSYALGSLSMVPMSVNGWGLTGEVASGAMSFEPMTMFGADHTHAEGAMRFQPMRLYGHAYEGVVVNGVGNAQGFSSSVGTTPTSAQSVLAVVANSLGTAESVLLVDLLLEAVGMSEADAVSSFDIESVLSAVGYSIVAANSVVSSDEQSPQVWVVNAENQGSTRYENYGFNSFAVIDGEYFGAKSDGVYKLEGDSDDGSPVQAMLAFGMRNFGTSAMKRVPNAYLGCSSTGRLFLKLLVDGAEYLYAARSYSETLDIHRVDLGQGVRANYIEFELYNSDGDDFELESVEFVVGALNRRI